MIEEFKMPQLGESIIEGTVVKWLVATGDMVALDQSIIEVMTDKVETEIPSPFAGTVTGLLVEEGETVPIGTPLITIDTATANKTVINGQAGPEPPAEKTGRETAISKPTDKSSSITVKVVAEPIGIAENERSTTDIPINITPVQRPAIRRDRDNWVSPSVKKLIKEHNLDIEKITGTGKDGRVSRKDLLEAINISGTAGQHNHDSQEAEPAETESPVLLSSSDGRFSYTLKPGDRYEKFSAIRKRIADHMVYSKRVAPHVACVAEVDMTNITRARAVAKTTFHERYGVRLTYMPFITYATVRALQQYPLMNGSVMDEGMVIKKSINISIAVDTPGGLMVPVVKNAQRHSIAELALQVDRLAGRAVEKKLTADDLFEGSFTVSNPGREGNLFGTPIINQPQVGIIRVGEIVKRPVVMETNSGDVIGIRHMSYYTLSYDHRVIDGAYANRFLHCLKVGLEQTKFDDLLGSLLADGAGGSSSVTQGVT